MELTILAARLRLAFLVQRLTGNIDQLHKLRGRAKQLAGDDTKRLEMIDRHYDAEIGLLQQRHDVERAALQQVIDALECRVRKQQFEEAVHAYTTALNLNERIGEKAANGGAIDAQDVCSVMLLAMLQMMRNNYPSLRLG